MESFINREAALKYIDDAFITLQDKKRLLQTPIMDFYGVKGIGKTLFLKKVQQRCHDKQLVASGLMETRLLPIRHVPFYSKYNNLDYPPL